MKKKKILLVNEASYLSTGLARYGKELLLRLHASGKYEVHEAGFYADKSDPRNDLVPWNFHPNKPDENDVVGMTEYNSNMLNQFGLYSFEKVLLDIKPDVVMTCADWWYSEWLERSPHRRFFRWIHLPTVDSIPQNEQWLSTYKNCDVVLAYTQFAKKALIGLDNVWGEVSYAGVEHDIFYPMDKSKVRSELGIENETILIGTTMRCQPRKLFPELFEAFARYLQVGPKDLTRKSLLYVHSTSPDIGWSFAYLLKKYNLGTKVLFTYTCRSCGAVFPAFFRDIRTTCESCKKNSAVFPSTQYGVSRESLAKIVNCFDVYAQYASSEGLGLPAIEAASCGIPVFATGFSAMLEVANLLGHPIKVNHLRTDVDFGTDRATPDADDFIQKLVSYLIKPDFEKERLAKKRREVVLKTFCWDRMARIWSDAIDAVQIPGFEYDELPALHNPVMPTQPFEDNSDFIRWCIINVLGRPEMVNSYMAMRMVRDLNAGSTPVGVPGSTYHNENSALGLSHHHEPFNPEIAINKLVQMREAINSAEVLRHETVNGRNGSTGRTTQRIT